MGLEKAQIGSAIYPIAASLLNHSCDPNSTPVTTSYVKDGSRIVLQQVTVASRVIEAGEEICHIYQGHFGDTPRSKRQNILQRMFHFECKCHACQMDYPTSSGLSKSYANTKVIKCVII